MKTYLVGGAVRDQLLGLPVSDRDFVVVGATAEEMEKRGFERVGASFPVFLHPHTREEYALARTETKNGVGYHGFLVDFHTGITLEDDLSRRDLTINSIAYDESTKTYVDPFDGRKDLERRVLRHTSHAFADDPLRVIRLARFAARFQQFEIDGNTMDLAARLVERGELNDLPFERFAAEVNKMLSTTDADGARRFFDVLAKLKVNKHVNFFRDANMKWLAAAARMSMMVEGADRLVVFAALSRLDTIQRTHLGGAEAAALGHLLDLLRSMENVTATSIHDFLRKASAWNSGKRWSMLMLCMAVGRVAGDWYAVSERSLLCAQKLTDPVASHIALWMTAEGKSGKEIGEAVKAKRIELLSTIYST